MIRSSTSLRLQAFADSMARSLWRLGWVVDEWNVYHDTQIILIFKRLFSRKCFATNADFFDSKYIQD